MSYMALDHFSVSFENNCVPSWDGLIVAELGDTLRLTDPPNENKEYPKARDFYLLNGAKLVATIDIHGKDSAIPIDLNEPIKIFHNTFDVVTDYGTLEHVTNQYQAFKNTHEITKIGGIMIHVLPLIDNWAGHCRWYYNINFANKLAELCAYEKIELLETTHRGKQNFLAFAFKKTKLDFISLEDFKQCEIHDSGKNHNMDNYVK